MMEKRGDGGRKSIAVWYAHKTGPLVNEKAGKPYGKGGQNNGDDDQIDGVRKQAASSPQGTDDRSTGNDPCDHRERKENEGDELTRDPDHEHRQLFGIRVVEQTLHGLQTKRNQQRE